MAVDLKAALTDKLGRDLGTYVGGLRSAGWSWREIAQDLKQRTGIYVSHEALRGWYRDELEEAKAS
jgi:intein-encoded DNA endonuclease-like protein